MCPIPTGGAWHFSFNVKFYPPDPAQLSEDITRYFKVGYGNSRRIGRATHLLSAPGKSMPTSGRLTVIVSPMASKRQLNECKHKMPGVARCYLDTVESSVIG